MGSITVACVEFYKGRPPPPIIEMSVFIRISSLNVIFEYELIQFPVSFKEFFKVTGARLPKYVGAHTRNFSRLCALHCCRMETVDLTGFDRGEYSICCTPNSVIYANFTDRKIVEYP